MSKAYHEAFPTILGVFEVREALDSFAKFCLTMRQSSP
jgi:hypothetical protein